jgi:hypothetical protein
MYLGESVFRTADCSSANAHIKIAAARIFMAWVMASITELQSKIVFVIPDSIQALGF